MTGKGFPLLDVSMSKETQQEEGFSTCLCGRKHGEKGETPSRHVCVEANTARRGKPPLVMFVWKETTSN